jgi:hypothetical protein
MGTTIPARRLLPAAVVMVAAMAGCAQAPKPLYHWDTYQRQVYEFLKGDGTTPAEQMLAMQAQAEKARATGGVLPPGFRAHVGMLHMQLGRFDEARQMLEAEKAAFPESAQYMDFLLKRFNDKKS